MIKQQEVRSYQGTLLVSKGQEVTSAVIFKRKNFHARKAIGSGGDGLGAVDIAGLRKGSAASVIVVG